MTRIIKNAISKSADHLDSYRYYRIDMVNIKVFFFTLIFLLFIILLINVCPFQYDLFQHKNDIRRDYLSKLSAVDVSTIKINHAKRVAPFDIGLFGNSRIYMIGQQEIGDKNGKVFNFAIGGQSLRQSLKLIEELMKNGKCPKRVIISFDYVELGLPGSEGCYPALPYRFKWRVKDFIAFSKTKYATPYKLIGFIYNNFYRELRLIKWAFDAKRLWVKLKLFFTAYHKNAPESIYRHDGSRKSLIVKKENKTETNKWDIPFKRQGIYPLLEYDLNRLKRIADQGIDVNIYESPIAPQIHDKVEKKLSKNARNVRVRLFEKCQELNLKCYKSPMLDGSSKGIFWEDTNHAPAQLLGEWIRTHILNSKK